MPRTCRGHIKCGCIRFLAGGVIGWIFIFATTAWPVMLLGLGTLSGRDLFSWGGHGIRAAGHSRLDDAVRGDTLRPSTIIILMLLTLSGTAMAQVKPAPAQPEKTFLRERWTIQSSAQVKEKGGAVAARHNQRTGIPPESLQRWLALWSTTKSIDPFNGHESESDTRLQVSDRGKLLAAANARR
jgi:hypothetical protein